MLINIWATITHLSDSDFTITSPHEPSLDLLICDGLRKTTRDKQIWAINPFYLRPGTTAALLRDSYASLRDANESYLVLFTPGFADVIHGVPAQLFRSQLQEIARRSRAFNKRLVTATLGTPLNAPNDIGNRIEEMNGVIQSVTHDWDGITVDLQNIPFAQWTNSGSRPANMERTAELIIEGIMQSHCASEEWRALQERSE